MLRTQQDLPAFAAHPKSRELLWFNQAHLFHVSDLDKRTLQGDSNFDFRLTNGKFVETKFGTAGRAALDDVLAFVRRKSRAFDVPGESSTRHDPLVQRVVGRIASLSYAADSLVDGVARTLQEARERIVDKTADDALFARTEVEAFQAQQIVIDLVLQASNLLFEVGGASATSEARRLDRHWRDARTAVSRNPAIARERVIGDYWLNDVTPPTPPAARPEPAGATRIP